MMIYPDIRLLLRALQRPEAHELAARFLPMEINYPAIGRWLDRVAALPGHDAHLAAALALAATAARLAAMSRRPCCHRPTLASGRGDCYASPLLRSEKS